jgi:hypothetical protein
MFGNVSSEGRTASVQLTAAEENRTIAPHIPLTHTGPVAVSQA